ncbi:hypothetical protein JCM3765_006473 [Sporobolomyces pararoseus]
MPIPCLPLDLVFEIISHLEEEEDDKIADQIQDGKTISLVCRAWRSLGQGLLWRTVIIEASTLPSLSDHFDQFPHLAKLVRSFKHNFKSSRDTDPVHLARIRRFLSTLINLHELSLEGKFEEDLVPILKVASSLESLRTMHIMELGSFEYCNEFSRSLRNGFNKLSYLDFMAYGPKCSSSLQHHDVGETISSKLSVSRALLGWFEEPLHASEFASDFLSIFDPAVLIRVGLNGGALRTTSIQWLSNCPNLTQLSLVLNGFFELSEYLPLLPHFPSLQDCHVQLTMVDETELSSFPLSSLLSSLPPSIQIFSATQLIFSDFSHIPVRQVGTDLNLERRKYIWARRSSSETEEGSTEMTLWGEEEEGKLSWFRQAD